MPAAPAPSPGSFPLPPSVPLFASPRIGSPAVAVVAADAAVDVAADFACAPAPALAAATFRHSAAVNQCTQRQHQQCSMVMVSQSGDGKRRSNIYQIRQR